MASRRAQMLLTRLPRAIAPLQRPLQPSSYQIPSSGIRQHPSFQPVFARLAHNIPRPRPVQSSSPETQTSTPSSPSSSSSSSSSSFPTPSSPSSSSSESEAPLKPSERVAQQPHYELTFTCVPCGDRSRHKVSKQGYHHGSVLITCPGCRNRHVISDHLNIFGNRSITVEDLLREKGQLVKRGTLGEDGDVEFWEDGSVTKRDPEDGARNTSQPADHQDGVDPDAPPGASFKSVRGQKSS